MIENGQSPKQLDVIIVNPDQEATTDKTVRAMDEAVNEDQTGQTNVSRVVEIAKQQLEKITGKK